MLNKDENNYGNAIQKLLNKLISEEWYAGQTYKLYLQSITDLEDFNKISQQLEDIANDELDDHLKKLCNFAKAFGYSVPCSVKDFEKHADPEVVKLFDTIKKNMTLENILKYANVSEQLALASYSEAKESDAVHSDQDLLGIILEIFYDECQHIQEIQFMNYAMQASECIA